MIIDNEADILKSVEHIHIWCDCGPHFRNKEFLYYALRTLTKQYSISIHFFGQCHGKGPCDSHFSILSKWLLELEHRETISTTKQLIAGWQEKSQYSKWLISFIEHKRDERDESYETLEFNGVKTYIVRRKV
jgi:hypothetical protein